VRLAGIIAVGTFVIDQFTKVMVVHWLDLISRGVMEVVPPFLVFRMAWNQGINFGLFAHDADIVRWVLVAVSLVIAAWVWVWVRRENPGRWAQVSAGLLIGGALGNVIDRVLYGAVADFLNMSCCGIDNPYAFNVADIAIFAGAIGLVIFTGGDKSGTKTVKARTKTP
jgi:signal peptidase II